MTVAIADMIRKQMNDAMSAGLDDQILNGTDGSDTRRITLRCPEDIKPGTHSIGGITTVVANGDTLQIDAETVIATDVDGGTGQIIKDLNGNPVPGGIFVQSGGRVAGKYRKKTLPGITTTNTAVPSTSTTRMRDLFPNVSVSRGGVTYPKSNKKWMDADQQIRSTVETLEVMARNAPAVIKQTLQEQIDSLNKEGIDRADLASNIDHPVHDVLVGDHEGVRRAIADALLNWQNNQVSFMVEMRMGLAVQTPSAFVKGTRTDE